MSPRDNAAEDDRFGGYLTRWRLLPDGAPIVTHSARLLPVRREDGSPAMLKIAGEIEEQHGGVLMTWWRGEGAARVYASDDGVLLLERAEGRGSLAAMARTGEAEDDAATGILCAVIARLHGPRPVPLPANLIPLGLWFRELDGAGARHGGLFLRAAATARILLAEPRDIVPLHGDIHHDNVLDFGARGWLAIDPKRLIGERAFDYANLFCNPDLATAADPGRFRRRLARVVAEAGIERRRLLLWLLAWCGLSAAWFLSDNDEKAAAADFAVAALVEAELARQG